MFLFQFSGLIALIGLFDAILIAIANNNELKAPPELTMLAKTLLHDPRIREAYLGEGAA